MLAGTYLACKQALWGALAKGQEKEGDLTALQLCLWDLNSTSNSSVAPHWLSCQISANQREAEMSASVNKHWKTHAKGNCVIINVISANQHFAATFSICRCRYLNSRHVVARSHPFPAPPPEHPEKLARRLVHILNKLFSSLDATWVNKQLIDWLIDRKHDGKII